MQKIIAELSEVVGTGSAYEIAIRWAGRELYIPETMTPQHPIALVIGMDAASKLSRAMACSRIRLPMERNILKDQRNKAIYRERENGRTFGQIALDYGLTQAAVIKIVRKVADEEALDAAA